MTNKWPTFVTKDLPQTRKGDAEMHRRWKVYDREMKVIIASGIAHQDEDGWWVGTATGELIGPDPEIERPRTPEELAQLRPFAEVFPEAAATIKRTRERDKFSSRRPLTDEEEAEIQAMIADDPDDEELTEEMAAQRMTFAEACPELAAAIRRERELKTKG